ncbi:l1 transposable element-related [Holotrichia oblita]|uniref:L1 transposable element-related n=1 Tax=Holotrichia oblita TaxID=644536 RepID=A0ACB9SID1_HOLOL|nr:l1 transposable element-related [Holotrichia oblita]
MGSSTRSVAEKRELIKLCVTELLQDEQFLLEFTNKVAAIVTKHLDKKFENYDARLSDLQDKNEMLSDKCDALEQYSRRNNVRIIGVTGVSPVNCENVVMDIINEKLKLTLPVEIIDRCHPVGPQKKDGKRDILVKFNAYRYRRIVLQKKSLLKGTGVSIMEDLTRNRYLCYRKVREKVGVKNAWVFDGNIYMKSGNSKTIVNKLADADRISVQ